MGDILGILFSVTKQCHVAWHFMSWCPTQRYSKFKWLLANHSTNFHPARPIESHESASPGLCTLKRLSLITWSSWVWFMSSSTILLRAVTMGLKSLALVLWLSHCVSIAFAGKQQIVSCSEGYLRVWSAKMREIIASSQSTREFITGPTYISALNYSLCGYFTVITWVWYFHFIASLWKRRSDLLWLPWNKYFAEVESKKNGFGICSRRVKCAMQIKVFACPRKPVHVCYWEINTMFLYLWFYFVLLF